METLSIILFVLQWSLAAVGIVGNIWVITAIIQYNAIKRTANKIMFINLAVADIGVLVVRNPFFFLTHYYNNRWFFGQFTCKFLLPISLTFMPASFLTLVAISYSRYRAIVYVKQLKELSVPMTKGIITCIWIFVIVFYPVIEIPVRQVNETSSMCDMEISVPIIRTLYAVEDLYFILAFLSIVVMFVRIRRALLKFPKAYNHDVETMDRLAKNIHALNLLWPVVVALFITVTPLMVGRVWAWAVIPNENAIPLEFYHLIDLLLITNSAINPFIYIIVSTEFRHKLCQLDCLRLRVLQLFARHQEKKSSYETNHINSESSV